MSRASYHVRHTHFLLRAAVTPLTPQDGPISDRLGALSRSVSEPKPLCPEYATKEFNTRRGRPRATWDAGEAPVRGEGYLGVDAAGDAHHVCERNGYVQFFDCPCCQKLHRRVLPCMAKDCWHCHEPATRRRGSRRHELTGGLGIMAIVVTIPRQWAPLISGELANRLRKVVGHLVLNALMKVRRVRMGVTVAMHPCGDRSDSVHDNEEYRKGVGEWGPHYHITAPLAGLRYGRVVRLRGWDKPSPDGGDGRLVRELKLKAQEFLDQLAVDLDVDPVKANVHYRYMKGSDPERVGHRLRYDLRTFPDWSASGCPELGKALIVRGYGLLSPNARCPKCAGTWGEKPQKEDAVHPRCACPDKQGLAGWRRAIRREMPEPEGPRCFRCFEKRKQVVRLNLLLITSKGSEIFRELDSISVDLDKLAGEGADRAQGPPPKVYSALSEESLPY